VQLRARATENAVCQTRDAKHGLSQSTDSRATWPAAISGVELTQPTKQKTFPPSAVQFHLCFFATP
jgi:hypothetical protein